MRIFTVVGARPQFVKAAVVSPALERVGIDEYLVHTGQHYDYEMSQIFFREFGMKQPDANLAVGSASHAVQTATMMQAIDAEIKEAGDIDGIMVYGDTNSTLATALVGAKLNKPVYHVEAGLRSFNKFMPEEQNRIITDRLSTLLFCPTDTAVLNLQSEGIHNGVLLTGDVMYEGVQLVLDRVKTEPSTLALDSISDDYLLVTIHRPSNVDDPESLSRILTALGETSQNVIFPVHPRTTERLKGQTIPANLDIIRPVGHGDMIRLINSAKAVLTDSGGIQKEAYWLGTPCITLRRETEWLETLDGGWNQLVGTDTAKILEALHRKPASPRRIEDNGRASSIIAGALLDTAGGQ